MVPRTATPSEVLLGILIAAGLDPQGAAWACDTFVLLVTGVAAEDDVRRARGRGDDPDRRDHADELCRTFAGLPRDRFPVLAAHAAQMVAGNGDERFQFAIDVVIDGLLARTGRR